MAWGIHIGSLYKKLAAMNARVRNGRLPGDFQTRIENFDFPGHPYTGDPEIIVTATLIVKPGLTGQERRHKSSKHRVFLVCPYCGREIPFGRWLQHRGTKACVKQ